MGIRGERFGAGPVGMPPHSAPGRDASTLIGLVPVISMWRAYKIPLPALVSADPYGTLCTPLLDRDMAEDAVRAFCSRPGRPARMR